MTSNGAFVMPPLKAGMPSREASSEKVAPTASSQAMDSAPALRSVRSADCISGVPNWLRQTATPGPSMRSSRGARSANGANAPAIRGR